jgi:Rrf2 family iron-sulfur cluster assembly transcriptional regulator
MRITQWGEYGVHCMVLLAKGDVSAPPIQAATLSSSLNIALDYTQQILQRLRKGGLIKTTRGPAGGYSIAKPAETITLRDILAAAEGDTFEIICEHRPLDGNCQLADRHCYLRNIWHGLKAHIDQHLSKQTLAEIVALSAQDGLQEDQLISISNRTQPPPH